MEVVQYYRNRWSSVTGTTGPIISESVVQCYRNGWSSKAGIRTKEITENAQFPVDTYAGRLHVEWGA